MRSLTVAWWLASCGFVSAQAPSIEKLAPPPAAVAEATASPIPAICPPDAATPPQKEWSGGFDFGLNGTSGNSEAFNMRFFANAKREWDNRTFTADGLYNYATAGGVVTQDMLLLNSRMEWALVGTPWSYFVSGGLQYDTFRAFDVLLFAHSGVGYSWWKNDSGFFKTRAGVGGSQEVGGPDDSFHPEALLGLDFERKITDRVKYVLGAVLFPDLGDWFEYRATVATHLEIMIDPTHNFALKIGAVDNYISRPEGRKANDLAYFLAAGWKY